MTMWIWIWTIAGVPHAHHNGCHFIENELAIKERTIAKQKNQCENANAQNNDRTHTVHQFKRIWIKHSPKCTIWTFVRFYAKTNYQPEINVPNSLSPFLFKSKLWLFITSTVISWLILQKYSIKPCAYTAPKLYKDHLVLWSHKKTLWFTADN